MKLIMRATEDKRHRLSLCIADLDQKKEAANHEVESFSDIPIDLRMSCLAFLSPRDLFLGFGMTSTDHRDQSHDERLIQFSPLVRFRVKPDETSYDVILRMMSTLQHAFHGSRNKLELLDLDLHNIVPTRLTRTQRLLDLHNMDSTSPTRTELQELRNAVTINPLLGIRHLVIPQQHILPEQRVPSDRISQLLKAVLKSATNLESYECHTLGGRIQYHSKLNNQGRLKSFHSNNNFKESPKKAFNLCGTAITEVSLENGIFLAGFSLLRRNLEGDNRECFLCRDHVHLETVNIAGAKCLTGMHPTRANRYLKEPVPQSTLMDFIRKNKKLRWIKCDLTPENVAVMKAECPEVTFVSSHLEM